MERREGSDMKFVFIAKHRSIWPLAWMCEARGGSRSGFHAWLRRKPSRRAIDDEAIGAKVRASFIDSARTYGARRVWRDVLSERLMRSQALRARPRRRALPKDSVCAWPQQPPTFSTASSRRSGRTRSGSPIHLYLDSRRLASWAAVIDLFSRRGSMRPR